MDASQLDIMSNFETKIHVLNAKPQAMEAGFAFAYMRAPA